MSRPSPSLETLRPQFDDWQRAADVMDQLIDLMLNHRQSGHPGGSRSKIPALVTLTLSGVMRWDVRDPGKAMADRFVLVAGHCTPAIYAMLTLYNEAMRRMWERTGDAKYKILGGEERILSPADLLVLRRNGGLPGHAECEGKTLFFKANTGPSGHGAPPAAGIALALKAAGLENVRVFAIEGEGGLTAGAHHETRHTAWGLGLGNLNYLLDWNDFGIDPRPFSKVMPGNPESWFGAYDFIVNGAEDGTDLEQLTTALLGSAEAPGDRPRCTWFRTVKGRGYGVTGAPSHGAAHKPNTEKFWETKRVFAEKYCLTFTGFGEGRPDSDEDFRAQTATNIDIALSLLDDEGWCQRLADTLVALGDSVPVSDPAFRLAGNSDPAQDPEITDPDQWPEELAFAPGEKQPNRKGFARAGAFLNSIGRRKYGRPLVLAASADLADSTNLSGFAHDHGDSPGFGWFDRDDNTEGALLPTGITEFTNAGIVCGLASTNLSDQPEENFRGFWGACSTYGSFSYLKYGPMRLFSQMVQDCPWKLGKVIWVAGHSGPETAEDSRTHFGIFSPGVTQLFPRGHVIDVHPWEANEVGPVLMAALGCAAPIVALHLTRPAIEIPDREALGMDSWRAAARGAYLLRDYDPAKSPDGCVFVRGTSTTDSVVQLLRRGFFEGDGPNLKLVAAISTDLFQLQPAAWRNALVSKDDWFDSTYITNGARKLMGDWTPHQVAVEYSSGADWDNRWRTGGSLQEIIQEAHLDPEHLAENLLRFAGDREQRLSRAANAPDSVLHP